MKGETDQIIEIPVLDLRLQPTGIRLKVRLTDDPAPEPPLRYEYFKEDFHAP